MKVPESVSRHSLPARLRDLARVEAGDRVAIHSENRNAWVWTDLGAQGIQAVSVGLYPTNPAAEVEYLLPVWSESPMCPTVCRSISGPASLSPPRPSSSNGYEAEIGILEAGLHQQDLFLSFLTAGRRRRAPIVLYDRQERSWGNSRHDRIRFARYWGIPHCSL